MRSLNGYPISNYSAYLDSPEFLELLKLKEERDRLENEVGDWRRNPSVPRDFRKSTEFSIYEKRLAAFLTSCEGRVFPTQNEIMLVLRIGSANTLNKYLKKLKSRGIISWVKGTPQSSLANRYSVHWPTVPNAEVSETAKPGKETL